MRKTLNSMFLNSNWIEYPKLLNSFCVGYVPLGMEPPLFWLFTQRDCIGENWFSIYDLLSIGNSNWVIDGNRVHYHYHSTGLDLSRPCAYCLRLCGFLYTSVLLNLEGTCFSDVFQLHWLLTVFHILPWALRGGIWFRAESSKVSHSLYIVHFRFLL